MNENYYPFTLSRREFRYDFVSVSTEKEVKKVVILSQADESRLYNLALFDVLAPGELSDISNTNNNDLRTVLATVMQIVCDFLDKNRDCIVIFRGSEPRRHRLYRIAISRQLKEISETFIILGIHNDALEDFEINQPYDFYLIKKRP